jgi:hypothetical protein
MRLNLVYSLRSLFCLLAVAAVACALYKHRMDYASSRRVLQETLSTCGTCSDQEVRTIETVVRRHATLCGTPGLTHWAARCGNAETLEFVLRHGGNPNERGFHGESPLIHAVLRNDSIATRLLLLAGSSDANGLEIPGCPPTILNAACENASVEVVKELVQSGMDVNEVNQNGWSSLHYAAASGSEKVVAYLLEHGASRSTADSQGRTPGDIAVMRLSLAHDHGEVSIDQIARIIRMLERAQSNEME